MKVIESSYVSFHQTKDRLIEEVISNIDDRFPIDSMSEVDVSGILNPRKCPAIANLSNYGNEELQVLGDHYGKRMAKMGLFHRLLMKLRRNFNGSNCAKLFAANYRHLSL